MPDTYTNSSNKYFDAFFRNAGIAMLIFDQAGIITAVNDAACRQFKFCGAELTDQSVALILPSLNTNTLFTGGMQGNFGPEWNKFLQPSIELTALKKDGNEFPAEVNLAFAHWSGGDFVLAIIHPLRNRRQRVRIPGQKDAQLEEKIYKSTRDLNKTLAKLKVAKARLEELLSFQKAILANAGVMIISTDEEGYIQTFNPEAERELGYSFQELKDNQKMLILHDHEEVRQESIRLTTELGLTVPPDMEVFFVRSRLGLHNEHEWTYIRKDGSRFSALLNITALKEETGKPVGFLGIAINISERKSYEYNLNKSLEREKELNDLKSKFVSMASHEFRTPLSTILSSVYLIEKYPASEHQPQREKHIHRIVSAVNSLSDILNDFLCVGKIEEGKMQATLKVFNIRALIEELVDDWNDQLKAGQKIHYAPSGYDFVELDPFLIRHILLNLVSNAIKFSPENRHIHIASDCSDKGVELTVADQGIGIAKEDQKHLMERFFRASNVTNIQGTGLGLHIVSKYVELLNGTISFRSELGSGTSFKVCFAAKTFPNENNTIN